MKQVPACEFFPDEALETNTIGTKNLVEVVQDVYRSNGRIKVLSVSTDKACSPINAYGMTKALQERIHLNGKGSIFNCVRYGNVLCSTGSVVPFFKNKIQNQEDLPITTADMTRFLMSLDESVDLIEKALDDDVGGKIFIPKIKSAKIIDIAEIMLENTELSYYISGIRPGEKIHESLISEEEVYRTEERDDVFIIHDIKKTQENILTKTSFQYCSKDNPMSKASLRKFLKLRGVI
jgi:FlaA1/EpsC-like NDP-sugar epimerase